MPLLLDGRGARTPAKNRLVAPTRAIAEAIAAEWAGQGAVVDPTSMPMTRLANSAIDGVARTLAETRADIARYAGADLICYRAEAPEALVAMQAEAFDPVLAWARGRAGRAVHPRRRRDARDAARARAGRGARRPSTPIRARSRSRRLHGLTSLSGSVLLALAVARGACRAEEAWRAAHVDEDFQILQWGEDDDAMARRAARWAEFEAAARVIGAV